MSTMKSLIDGSDRSSTQRPTKRARSGSNGNEDASGAEEDVLTENEGDQTIINYVSNEGRILRIATSAQKSNRTIVMAAISNDGTALEFASEDLRADRDVVLAALQHTVDANVLRFASPELRGDRGVVTLALSKPRASGDAEPLALVTGKRLLNDLDVVLRGVMLNGNSLRLLPEAVRGDRDIVIAAVTSDGSALEHASSRFRNDEEVVMKAVNSDGRALRFASASLRADRNVVLSAVTNRHEAIEHVSPELPVRGDREMALAFLRHKHGVCFYLGQFLVHFDEELLNDREITLALVKKHGFALERAPPELQGDREIVACAVRKDGRSLQLATDVLRSDKEIALLALQQQPRAIQYVGKILRDDPDVIAAAAPAIVDNTLVGGVFVSFHTRVGPILQLRLHFMHRLLQQEEDLPDEDEFVGFAEMAWRKPSFEKIWLLHCILDGMQSLDGPIEMLILQYTGCYEKIQQAKELAELSNLYCKFAVAGWDWDDIPCD